MRTESRKRRRPAPAPDDLDTKAVPGAGPKPLTPSSESASPGTGAGADVAPGPAPRQALPPIALTPDGRIDLEKVRPATRERLKKAFDDADLHAALGLTKPAATVNEDESAVFASHVAPALYNALNALLTAFPRRYGYTAEAAQVMAFSTEEVQHLAPLTGKVLAKHLGGRSKYQDEFLLATMVLSGIMAKVTLLEKQATVLKLQRDNTKAAASTTVAPIAQPIAVDFGPQPES